MQCACQCFVTRGIWPRGESASAVAKPELDSHAFSRIYRIACALSQRGSAPMWIFAICAAWRTSSCWYASRFSSLGSPFAPPTPYLVREADGRGRRCSLGRAGVRQSPPSRRGYRRAARRTGVAPNASATKLLRSAKHCQRLFPQFTRPIRRVARRNFRGRTVSTACYVARD